MNRLLSITLGVAVVAGLWFFFLRHNASPQPVITSVESKPVASVDHPQVVTVSVDQSVLSGSRPASLVEKITRALRHGSAAERDYAFQTLLPLLIAQSTRDATRLAEGWEPGELRNELIRQVTHQLAASDIGAAVIWLAGLDQPDQSTAVRVATAQVAQSDQPGAIALAQAFQHGMDDGSLEHLTQLWTEEHPVEAIAWINTQPAGPSRDRLVARIAHVRAQQKPTEAIALVLNHMPPGKSQDDTLMGVLRQWRLRDPVAAKVWVDQLPFGSLRDRAVNELVNTRSLR